MNNFHLLSLLLIPFFYWSCGPSGSSGRASDDLTRVRISSGQVEGTREASGIISFKGIPYAEPPVGELRWTAPKAVDPWDTVLIAKQFGPRAMQAPIFGDMGFRSNGMSEDCLYLNVWTPARSAGDKLPVLVYFYGGGFVAGDGSEARYDGESMAKKGIVALTVNYRLGVFGMMAHPELTAESPNKASGNYTLLDQAAALKWVKNNIAAFGGDPGKITIAGESAGSVSVSAQMASPLSRDLLFGAIGESGSLLGTLSAVPLAAAEQNGIAFAKTLGAGSLKDLRNIPADSLLAASMKYGPFRFSMNVDGYFFPRDPYKIFESGEQSKVPLLVGWNSEEMNYRSVLGNEKTTKENYEKAIRRLYNDQADEVLKLYPAASDEQVEKVATELAGDRFISFSTWKWADLHSKTADKPVYRYYYERPRPAMREEMGDASPGLAGGVQRGQPRMPPAKGAVHSAEIEYAMGNLHYNKVYAWTEDDFKVSRIMQEYFANFIKKGDPNGDGLPAWSPIRPGVEVPVMHIDVHTRQEPEKNRERYIFMEKIRR